MTRDSRAGLIAGEKALQQVAELGWGVFEVAPLQLQLERLNRLVHG